MKSRRKNLKVIPVRAGFVLFILIMASLILSAVAIASSLVGKYTNIDSDTQNVIWVVAAGIIISFSVYVFVGAQFIRPIQKLNDAMEKVSNGNYKEKLDTKKGMLEIRTMNESFNMMTAELEATEILQTDFVSNVSHEFKTPINAIEGYAMLLQDCTDEQKAVYTEKILYNTARLSSLVGNILLLSKVDNKKINPEKTVFRLDEQIRKSILFLEPRWLEKHTEFDVELENVEYEGGENLLLHVWNNLIENAIKFGPENGKIYIRLNKDNDKTVFTIEDEGCGIDEDEIKHIFDRFYQGDSSHKSEGNGLGLALVKRIIDMEEGEIKVESLKGHGCKFTVILQN